ncbi:hypothetical protein [Paraburkholderia aspalathi]
MSFFENACNEYVWSVETLTPEDVFMEVADPDAEKGALPALPLVPA